ncbi:hypothetical protein [Streptomyces sp. NPDC017260]|uniref:hypothetical protein n=1 Tax=unclassified Streptomyces TaxID=2593676 RepID=UPI0037A3084F
MSSDFWLNKMRGTGAAPAPASPQAGLTPSGTPWWAHPTYTRPEQPAQEPQQPPEVLQRSYQTGRAQSAQQTERCPSCGSDQYWRATPNTQAMCNECHWPVQNSTQGVAISNRDSPSKASLHQAKGAGYRPDLIVGRM